MKQSRGSAAHLPARRAASIRLLPLLIALAVALVFGATASADEFPMTPEAAQEALAEGERVESQLTDPKAAEQLPHRDLERAQALQLLSAVFGTQIEGVAGIFNDLDVDHFLSDNAAVIDAGDQPEAAGVVIGEGGYDGPALLESTVPLRTEDQSGEEAPVDLGLEHTEGEVQPSAPLVEVGIPSELGEGIDLPESEVGITLAGSPQGRAPSIVNQAVAVYPEVAEDTSFAVAPSPTGVETFTLLQSPDAPDSATYQLSLPEGTSLAATDDGGAEVSAGDEPLLRVLPPAAMDAEGNNVPVELEVSGDSFTVQADPPQGAAYPILVDPVVETYKWYGTGAYTGLSDWLATSNNQGLVSDSHSALWQPGADLRAVKGFTLPYNAKAHWAYSVPRFASDEKEWETPPISFISKMVTTNVFFVTNEDKSLYPMMAMGIWNNATNNWMSAWGHGGNTGNVENMATTYTFENADQNAKQAIGNELWAGEAHTMTSDRETYLGAATIELADKELPAIATFAPPEEEWIGKTAPGIPFVMSDKGLGVLQIITEEPGVGGTLVVTNQGCIGIVSSPCPRTWSENGKTSWLHIYDPSKLSQGTHKMVAFVKDAVGNVSAPWKFTLKVDRTAPGIALGGTLTEQATLGTKRPSYALTTTNTDGTEASPQAGVASTEITVDGKKVDSTAAGCATQNCSVTRNWTLESKLYSAGKHVVVVKATDGAGNTTEKTLNIEIQKDTTAPTISSTTNGLENVPSGWVEQKGYKLGVSAQDAEYGVTSLEFKMDGKVVKSTTASCPKGACSLGMAEVSVSMSGYTGGSHSAEYIAKDGAGNVAKRAWTINVDPGGAVTASEATDTIEALEETTEASPVAPNEEILDPAEIEAGINPALKTEEGKLISTGTGATTVMTTNPKDGITIEGGEGNVAITPIGGIGTTGNEVVSDVAAVSGGTSTDTVTRPLYDGTQTFRTIRDESAPETYSWTVTLSKVQTLKTIDSEHVAIFNGDGTQAVAITAAAAHDATGKAVPTSLSVSEGNVLTLTIKYKGKGFVYPIIGGPAFQSSYTLPVVWEPPNNEKEWEDSSLIVGAPEPIPSDEATASTAGGSRKKFVRVICGHSALYSGGFVDGCGNPFIGDKGNSVTWHAALRGAYLYKPGAWAEQRGARACAQNAYQTSALWEWGIEEAYECHYGPQTADGNGGSKVTGGHYLRAQAHWKLGHYAICASECNGTPNPTIWEDKSIELHLWPSGAVQLIGT